MQSDAWSLPVALTYLPAEQSMQSDAWSLPDALTYLPARHSMHEGVPWSGWYRPATHEAQPVVDVCLAAADDPLAHGTTVPAAST
jgi:hypothetical protein